MRVLVTGGSGFIGRHLVKALLARGDEVRIVDLVAPADPSLNAVVGDLRERAVVRKALDESIEAVVHLAAITSVLQSVQDPDGVFATNVDASQLLLERCRELGVDRFVFASTNAVVGNVGAKTIDESSLLAPLTAYGATKAATEMLLSAYHASYAMVPISLRFTNVYGAGMQTKDSVVARLMRCALSGESIKIYGDGEQVRDYVYVLDAVEAILLALGFKEANTLTIGSGSSVSMNELHRMCCQATGIEIAHEHVAPKPGEMPAVIVSIEKGRRFGYVPAFDLLAGLQATWADFSTALDAAQH